MRTTPTSVAKDAVSHSSNPNGEEEKKPLGIVAAVPTQNPQGRVVGTQNHSGSQLRGDVQAYSMGQGASPLPPEAPYSYPMYYQPYIPMQRFPSYPYPYQPMPIPFPVPYPHTVVTMPGGVLPERPIFGLISSQNQPQPTLAIPGQAVPIPPPQVAQPQENLPEVPPGSQREDKKADHPQPNLPKEDRKENSSEEEKSSQNPGKPSGPGTYKHRNVFKSIIRHMYSCTRRQRNQLVDVLLAVGFSMGNIEHAFYEIGCYNDMERQKGKKKISQSLVKRIASDKSIFTYILRETLHIMLQSWDEGKFGRLTKKNVATYKDVCTKYYNETVRVLGQPAQITSFQS